MENGESDNDLETLLEKSIDEQLISEDNKIKSKDKKCPFQNRKNNRTVKTDTYNKIDEKVIFNRRLLPDGWVRLYHQSGMYYYFHAPSKVVTWAMPYQLQLEPGRVHRIPVRAIPCLSYSTMKEGNDKFWKDLTDNVQEINKNDVCDNIQSETKTKVKEEEEVREEGEVESSDDEGKETNNANSNKVNLPMRYQISSDSDPLKRNNINHNDCPINKRQRLDSNSFRENRRDIDSNHSSTSTPISNKNKNDPIEPSKNELNEEFVDYGSKLLTPPQFRNYCDKLFDFVDVVKQHFQYIHPKNSRKKTMSKDELKTDDIDSANKSSLPASDTMNNNPLCKPIENNQVPHTCTHKIKIPNKNIHIELAGRGLSCILNMYCQNAYGVSPTFDFNNQSHMSSSAGGAGSNIHDFQAQCLINGTGYGIGQGKTKKSAKQKSVLKTLEILIPGFIHMISSNDNPSSTTNVNNDSSLSSTALPSTSSSSLYANSNSIVKPSSKDPDNSNVMSSANDDEILSIFDSMDVTDPRVLSYSIKLNIMTPHDLFLECINRHCISDSQIHSTITKKDRHNLFLFKVGDKQVEVVCENKREGRQLAAQYMLQKMHPHIQAWSGILRLYGPGSKPVKRFDMVEMQNLLLEDRGGVKNNLINLLRRQMLQLHDEWETNQSENGSDNTSSHRNNNHNNTNTSTGYQSSQLLGNKAKFKVNSYDSLPVIVFHADCDTSTNNCAQSNNATATNSSSADF